ncbi:MAG: hypothetical protein EBS64_07795 [Verrucomicrobia bacterium]|nr:hypothetical protein [Verrucomicrobiota bacterium]
MDNFKKNKLFYVGLSLVGVVFLAGIYFSVVSVLDQRKTTLALEKVKKETAALLAGHVFAHDDRAISLTDDNVKNAAKDLAELNEQLTALRISIASNPELIIRGKQSTNSNELNATLKQSVDEWKKLAVDHDVKILPNDQCDFGFRRYIRNPGTSPKREFQRVDQQRMIIDFLYRQLVESRPVGAPLLLLSVDREPVETFVLIPEGKPGAGTYGPENESSRNENDEFSPTRTFDRMGLVETLSFRLRFAGTTPTLRTFVNKVRNSGRAFAITSVEVRLPAPEITKAIGIIAAPGAPAAPAKDVRTLVFKETPSEFIVQIDYLSIPEEKPAAPEGEAKK